jgi:hypothetical protein
MIQIIRKLQEREKKKIKKEIELEREGGNDSKFQEDGQRYT